MKKLIPLLFAAIYAQAATLYVSPVPTTLNPGDTFDVLVGFVPDPLAGTPEELALFNIDLLYSSDVVPGDPQELGYFLSNGLFFFFQHDTNAIRGVSDLLAGGDSLKFADMLFRVPFTYMPPGSSFEPPFIEVDLTATFLDGPDFTPITFTLSQTDAPVAPVPEPATVGLIGAGLMAMGASRRRRL